MTQTYTLGASTGEQERLQAQRLLYGDTLDLSFAGGSVVEIGCGPFVNSWIAREAHSYTGVDIQEGQIATARALAGELGITNSSFLVAPGDNTGLSMGAFDAVFIRCLLVHLPNPLAVLIEARRLLSERGRLIVIEPDDLSVFATPGKEALNRCWAAKTELTSQTRGTSAVVARRLYSLMVEAGFQSPAIQLHLVQANGSDPGRCQALMRNWAAMIERVGEELIQSGRVNAADIELAALQAAEVTPQTFATLNMWRAFATR